MSHYTKMTTQIRDKECLLKALKDLGFGAGMLKVSEQPMHLEGFQGDRREQTAEIIIPRRHVGGASNDIGFTLQADGTFGAIISDYDKSRYNEKWLNQLAQRYGFHYVSGMAQAAGITIESTTTEKNGELVMNLVRYA